MVRLPVDLERDIARFQKFLREIDAEGVMEYGYTQFQDLYNRIDRILFIYPDYEGPSNLDAGYNSSGDKLAKKIGKELEKVAREMWEEQKKFDRHVFIKIGEVLELAHDIAYYGEG